MTNPIDIIADRIHAADSNPALQARALAGVAVDALNDPTIIANAVQALEYAGWGDQRLGGRLDEADLTNIARTVLRSVGGA